MNKKRDLKFIVIGIVFLFVIAGCKGGVEAPGGAPTTPFIGGSKGLEIGFLDGLPPTEVTDRDFPFQAIVSLKNQGEYKLPRNLVKVDLIGFLPSDFLVDSTAIASLKNRQPESDPTPRQRDSEGNIIEPEETFVTFPQNGEFSLTRGLAGNTVFIFRADVCYRYVTDVLSEICVLKNLIDVADDSICDTSGSKSVFSSSSPVIVDSFRQNVVGKNRIQFSFDIVHSGPGDVFEGESGGIVDCPRDTADRRRKEEKVKVYVVTGLPDLECVTLTDIIPDSGLGGFVKLVNGKRTVTCTQGLSPDRSDFKKDVRITLEFNYADSTDRKVLVKHLLG